MNISKKKYICLNTMSNELLKLEECINNIGVETRTGEDEDRFRNFYDILFDVAKVVCDNPTILSDVKERSFSTGDELIAFLSQYNLSGISCVACMKD